MHRHETIRWRSRRPFRGSAWPDGAVVYDAASGDTHQLSPLAYQILTLIQEAPATQEALAARVTPASLGENDVGAALAAIVLNLHELGLIEPEPH